MCVSDGQWLAEEVGESGEGRLHRAGSPAMCVHWDRQQRAGDATAQSGGEGRLAFLNSDWHFWMLLIDDTLLRFV